MIQLTVIRDQKDVLIPPYHLNRRHRTGLLRNLVAGNAGAAAALVPDSSTSI